MKHLKTKVGVGVVAAALAVGGFTATQLEAAPEVEAEATACVGSNSRELTFVDAVNGWETWEVKIDSCGADQMIESMSDFSSRAGYIAALGGFLNKAVGPSVAIIGGWAWDYADALDDCNNAGTGVTFTEQSGIVTQCRAQ